MKRTTIVLFTVLAFIFACNNGNNKETTDNTDTTTENESDVVVEAEKGEKGEKLTILGDNIWVRSVPKTGEVVMKLNNGTVCEVLDKGEQQEIRKDIDYWYKIRVNDKEGWVFGSQTSLKTGEVAKVTPFTEVLIGFLTKYVQNNDINRYIHPQIKVYHGTNPGVACTVEQTTKPECKLPPEIGIAAIFDKVPQGDFCEGYPNEKSGYYFYEINADALPLFSKWTEDGNLEKTNIVIPANVVIDKLIEVKVLKAKYHKAALYFAYIGGEWYFICQSYCDCSA